VLQTLPTKPTILEYRAMANSKNSVILNVIHHRQNYLESIFSIVVRGLVAVGTYLFRGRYLVTGLHATMLSFHL
jgi:hypothetical protein